MSATPSPSIPSTVHDIFGPGNFIAWILVSYTLCLQLLLPDRPSLSNTARRKRDWNLDKDLFATLLYTHISAGYLLRKSYQDHPRTPQPIFVSWFAGDSLSPAMAPILVASQVCIAGLGMCILLLLIPPLRTCKIRVVGVGITATFLFATLCAVHLNPPATGGTVTGLLMLTWGFFCIFPGVPGALAVVICCVLVLLGELRRLLRLVFSSAVFSHTSLVLLWVLGDIVLGTLVLATAALCSLAPVLLAAYVPRSGHTMKDLGQVVPLVIAIVNAVCVFRGAVLSQQRKNWLKDFVNSAVGPKRHEVAYGFLGFLDEHM